MPSKVNDINFENMSNDDAVRVLREIVHKPGWVVVFSFYIIWETRIRPCLHTSGQQWLWWLFVCLPGPSSSLWLSAGTLPLRATSLCLAVSARLPAFLSPSSLNLWVINDFLMSSPPVQMNRSDPLTLQRGWVTLWLWPGPTPPSQAAPPLAPSPPPPPSPRPNVRASFQCLPHHYLMFCVL